MLSYPVHFFFFLAISVIQNSVAIWDNRSNYHTATFDYGTEKRTGDRVVSLVKILAADFMLLLANEHSL